ncbi:hypothetical protein LZ012_17510 [Dechloromonas sp. XY25]|uniref:Uncharacterized protein n=1 Tax=Dechloromonas hankyongensis TaxID=2908002 RepID=A0ABS9K6N4_9RHOO|nr:hypothetical protein [Dechloromonas hankyongensis]MCG2578798.1 hypothetical protein [Dechloromonas hankyongensis]
MLITVVGHSLANGRHQTSVDIVEYGNEACQRFAMQIVERQMDAPNRARKDRAGSWALSQTLTARSMASGVGTPASFRASRAPSATAGCGRVPADMSRTWPAWSWFRMASAIWERPELSVHGTSTVFGAGIGQSSLSAAVLFRAAATAFS